MASSSSSSSTRDDRAEKSGTIKNTILDRIARSDPTLIPFFFHPPCTYDEDPKRDPGGLWQQRLSAEVGEFSTLLNERMVEFTCTRTKEYDPTVGVLFYLLLMLTRKCALRVHLERSLENDPRKEFYKKHYRKYLKLNTKALLESNFTHENVVTLVNLYVSRMQSVWSMQDRVMIAKANKNFEERDTIRMLITQRTKDEKHQIKRLTQLRKTRLAAAERASQLNGNLIY